MSSDLPKNYDPAAVESQAYDVWLKEKLFHAEPADSGDPYCIVIPPPNVTGALHLGHAINETLQDILTRVHRMRGYNAVWIPGIDHAGIATQAVVERTIKETEGKDRYSLAPSREESRNELVRRIWQWKEQYGNRIIEQMQRLGCSCDWDRTRFTLDEQCAKAVRETFFKLFKDGLIYRGKRLVNWDIHLQTSISDDEIYHETVKTSLWHIKYPIVDENGHPFSGGPQGRASFLTVATTRPETMLGDTAVAVHSEDPRWNWAIGKSVKLPLTNRLIPIIADDILVDPKFGTGVVKVTPAHDPNDYAVYQRHLNQPDKIDIINILNPDGTLNENAGPYKGMQRNIARKKVVEDLGDLLLKEEPYETQVGHSDRSKTPVEPYLSDQWFVQMAPLAEPALEVVRNGTIKFFPERHAQQYLSWLGEKRDWPISRQLWWGHRIPVWTYQFSESSVQQLNTKSGSPANCDAADHAAHEALCAWLISKPNSVAVPPSLQPKQIKIEGKSAAGFPWPRDGKLVVCIYDDPEVEQQAKKLGFVQDPDVLDTWFSSALWPHSTLGWPEQTAALGKWYPTSVLLTGRDIITLWVARMVMMGMYNMGGERRRDGETKRRSDDDASSSTSSLRLCVSSSLGIPFHHVAINPTILDGRGERMSKSKGNGVDPVDIVDTHGADALRFTLTSMATETQDVRMPVKKLPDGKNTSEKFDFGRNFCNKLWNAARFVLASLEEQRRRDEETKRRSDVDSSTSSLRLSVSSSLADDWIISRFNHTIKEANAALRVYRFDQYAKTCYDFFWRDLCDWYIEAAKPALRDKNRAAQTANVLATMLDGALRLMHPIIPFITETIWWRLNEVRPQRGLPGIIDCPPSQRLIKAAWPSDGPIDESAEHIFPRLQTIVSTIRNLRNEHNVDPRTPVTVSISPPGEQAVQVTLENRELIETLAICAIKAVQSNLAPPSGAIRATVNGDCDVFIEGLVDEQADKQRIDKRREELTKKIANLNGRLSNESYLAKAPPHLVQQTRDQLADAEAELAKLT